MQVYFNPACSKCRNAIAQLDEKGTDYELVRYLDETPTTQDLQGIVSMLEDPIEDLVRKDKRFAELGLNESDYTTADGVVALLEKHPELMQRPVIVKDGKATIARTPEKVEEVA